MRPAARVSRRALLGMIGASFAAGCLGNDPGPPGMAAAGDTDVAELRLPGSFDLVPVGADPPASEPPDAPPFGDRVLPLPMTPRALSEHAVRGGPPKDGIPAIDNPVFTDATGAGFLDDDAVVLGVTSGAEAKAYPRMVLVRHEIVNDTLDDTPVSVTYCPLTGTALGFERGRTTLGVSGWLINNNPVMFDRQLERWWPQIPAVSIPGRRSDTPGGAALREFTVVRTTWRRWRARHPDTLVMTETTGFARDYANDPYAPLGYYTSNRTLFANTYTDDQFHAKTWVYGVRTTDGAACFLKDTLRAHGVIHGTAGATPVVAVYDRLLDTAYVYANPHEDRFRVDRGRIRGPDGSYAPRNLPLDPLLSFDAFWFSWVASYPFTTVYA